MVIHDMAFQYRAFLLGGELAEPFAQYISEIVEYCLISVFGDEHHMVFAFPSCVCETILCYGHGMLRCIQLWRADANVASISVTVKLC